MNYDQTAALVIIYALIGIYQAMKHLLDDKANPSFTSTAFTFFCWPLVVFFKAIRGMMP